MITSFKLIAKPPFRLEFTAWALRRRSQNQMDIWEDNSYRRVLTLNKRPFLVIVGQRQRKIKTKNRPKIRESVAVSVFPAVNKKQRTEISANIKKMMGLELDLTGFYKLAAKDANLKILAAKFKGVKPVRFASIFECLINAISCQQLSLDVGIILLNRLTQKYGKKVRYERRVYHAFPLPNRLRTCSIQELRELGFSFNKSRTIIQVANIFSKDEKYYEDLVQKSNDEIMAVLCAIKGIGRWSAEYALLRGYGKIDTFPGDDVGARNNLKKQMHLTKKLNYTEISKITRKWHPYEGFVYFHFLLNKLQEKGYTGPV